MGLPRRQRRQEGRYALADGIPFHLPVNSEDSPALMAAFSVDGPRRRKRCCPATSCTCCACRTDEPCCSSP